MNTKPSSVNHFKSLKTKAAFAPSKGHTRKIKHDPHPLDSQP
jgi:hypothetical protein